MKKIIIKSLCKHTLSAYLSFIQGILKSSNISYSLIFLPIKEKKITLLKSPHVFKKSKEQFKISTFKALLIIKNFDRNNILDLGYFVINKPKSIFIKIKSID